MTALKLNHKNVPVGSFRNRDEETNKMTGDVINDITLVCDDDMLIKAHAKVLSETNETLRGKLDKETNEKTIEVATLVILFLDEDIIIKAHKHVLDPYLSSPIFHLLSINGAQVYLLNQNGISSKLSSGTGDSIADS